MHKRAKLCGAVSCGWHVSAAQGSKTRTYCPRICLIIQIFATLGNSGGRGLSKRFLVWWISGILSYSCYNYHFCTGMIAYTNQSPWNRCLLDDVSKNWWRFFSKNSSPVTIVFWILSHRAAFKPSSGFRLSTFSFSLNCPFDVYSARVVSPVFGLVPFCSPLYSLPIRSGKSTFSWMLFHVVTCWLFAPLDLCKPGLDCV